MTLELVSQKTIALVNLDALPDDCHITVMNKVLTKHDFMALIGAGLGQKPVPKQGKRLSIEQRSAIQNAPASNSDVELARRFDTTSQTIARYRRK